MFWKIKPNEATGPCSIETKSGGRKAEWFTKVKVKKHHETCATSGVELDDWDESRLSDIVAWKGVENEEGDEGSDDDLDLT